MKAATLTNRPGFSLMRQSDIQSFYHLQMPRWLFYDKRYTPLSLEAKVVYTFLLNRFQLSKLNNWINDNGEVFIIYTRQSLADETQVSYRRIIECVKELKAMELIWEHRCGRGDANQIYLARAGLTDEYCENRGDSYDSAPFTTQEDLRPADSAHHNEGADAAPEAQAPYQQDGPTPPRPVEKALQEVQEQHVKNCGNGTSRSAEPSHQDLPKLHSSYIDKSNTGTIRNEGTNDIAVEQIYDVKIVIGEIIYLLDTASGHFSRERDMEVVHSILEDIWLLRVCTYLT